MAEKTKKHKAILNSARTLFRQYGMKKVSIEEVCQAAGASKMTFYKYFENKEKLAIAVFDEILQEGLGLYQDVMESSVSFYEKITGIIRLKHTQQDKVGELFMEDLLNDHIMQEYLMTMQKENVELSLKIYKEGMDKKEIREEVTPEYFLYLLEAFTRLYQEPGFKRLFPGMHERTDQIMNLLFFGISRPNKRHGGAQ